MNLARTNALGADAASTIPIRSRNLNVLQVDEELSLRLASRLTAVTAEVLRLTALDQLVS